MADVENRRRPTGIVLFVIWQFVEGMASAVLAVLMIRKIGAIPVSAFSIALGVVHFLTMWGLWRLKNWARILAIILAISSLPRSIIGLWGGDPWMIGRIVIYGAMLWYLLKIQTKEIFAVKARSCKVEFLFTVTGFLLISIAIGTVIHYTVLGKIIRFMTAPLSREMCISNKLILTGLPEALYTKIIVSLTAGFILAVPYLFIKGSHFLANNFFDGSKNWFLWLSILSNVLFLLGIGLSWFIFLPLVLKIVVVCLSTPTSPLGSMFGSMRRYVLLCSSVIFFGAVACQMPFAFWMARLVRRKGTVKNSLIRS